MHREDTDDSRWAMQAAREHHVESLVQLDPRILHRRFLILALEDRSGRLEVSSEENTQRLIRATGRRQEIDENLPPASLHVSLFRELTLGGNERIFARNIEEASGNLPQIGLHRMTRSMRISSAPASPRIATTATAPG